MIIRALIMWAAVSVVLAMIYATARIVVAFVEWWEERHV